MPALKIFGRRWLISSDDVPVPAFFLTLFRVVWCGLLTGWLISIHGPRECVGAWRYDVAAGGLLGFFTLSLGLEAGMTAVGLRGSLFEPGKRAALAPLIYADVAAFAGQLAFNTYCTVLLYRDPPECEVEPGQLWRPEAVLKGLAWSTWGVTAAVLLLLALTYNLYPDYAAVESWEARWSAWARCCFCCSTTRKKERRQDLAARLGRIFALMFGHIDMTASDIITCFVLAMTLQKIRRRSLKAADRAGSVQLSSLLATPGASQPLGSLNADRPGSASSGSAQPLVEHAEPTGKGLRRRPTLSASPPRHGGHGGGDVPSVDDSDSEDGLRMDVEAGPRTHVDAGTVEEAAHFMTYAFAAYGYLLYIWGKPATGVLDLCCGRNCGLLMGMVRSRDGGLPDLRVLLNLNREATQQAAGLRNEDLVFVRYEAEVPNVLPYFIGLDRSTKTVVLAIRGSLSLDDVVRDLLMEPASLDAWLDAPTVWGAPVPEIPMAGPETTMSGHAGMCEAARATIMDLQEMGHLWELTLAPDAPYRDWKLVVTGHSLGAGCAFLVCLYLRRGIAPDARCWAFSPPGGLASTGLGDRAVAWCTSVVCGKEWIPRLTARSFDALHDDMVLAGLRCRLPKLAVWWGVLRRRAWTEAELFAPAPRGEAAAELAKYQASVAARGDAAQQFYTHAMGFGPPGRLLYLQSLGSTRKKGWRGGRSHEYRPVWIRPQELAGEGIILSGRMMADHMPDHLLALLRKVAARMRRSHSTARLDDRAGREVLPHALEPGADDRPAAA